MAKITKKSKEEKLIENLEEVEAKEAETDEETIDVMQTSEDTTIGVDSITMDTTALEPKASKMVRIRVKEKFKCHIGGEWYYFEKNKVYSVPEEVKNILMQGDKLLPM